jgi:Zn-dependent protease with chaperone function
VAGPVRALLYDGRTSHAEQVFLALESRAGTLLLLIDGHDPDPGTPVSQLTIGERVGNTNRCLKLPLGRSLEVLDNEQFDAALSDKGLRTAEEPIRRLELRWRYAVIAGISATVIAVGFLRFGLPAIAARAVRYIPPGVDAFIAQDTLRILDATTFSPSNLSSDRKEQIRALFAEVTRDAGPGSEHFRLEFRAGGAVGPNALALPSGIVVLTDELVVLAKNDDELRGVFAHEVGHLVNRHAMRMLVQGSASALLMVGIFGDASAASSLTAVAPTVLVSSAYSRDFERQADEFAFHWMTVHGVSPRHLGDLLARLGKEKPGEAGGYLASHPELEERIRAANHPHSPSR